MQTRPWIIATAVGVAVAAAGVAHYIALSCCYTPLSIVGLLGYSLRDGDWLNWLAVSVLGLSAVVALDSLDISGPGPSKRAIITRCAEVLMWAGLGIAVLVPTGLWVFVFAPFIDRLFGGVWAYYIVQSPLVETFLYIAMGSLSFAIAGWARLRASRRRPDGDDASSRE